MSGRIERNLPSPPHLDIIQPLQELYNQSKGDPDPAAWNTLSTKIAKGLAPELRAELLSTWKPYIQSTQEVIGMHSILQQLISIVE